MKTKSIFSQLRNEHNELKELLKKAEDCSESKRSQVLEEIEEHLIPHARGEEKTLYALMRKRANEKDNSDGAELINEAYEEHRVADELMKHLKNVDPSDETWLAHLKVVKENLEHHIEEEEEDLFYKAKKLLSSDDRKGLLEAYLTEKENFSESLPTQGQIHEREISSSFQEQHP